MIISFWSSTDLRVGVTTGAACISYFYAERFKKKVVLFENHVPSRRSLEDVLIGRNKKQLLYEEPIYYNKSHNINYIYGLLKSGQKIPGFKDVAIHLANGSLHYLPMSSSNHDLFDYELNKIIDNLIKELERRYEIVFVDLKRINTLTTKKILEKSNFIFLNVPQEELNNIDEFLCNNSIDYNKIYFLVGRYKDLGNISFEEFISEYNFKNKNISYIPNREILEKVCENGNLAKFLTKNLWTMSSEKNFEIINQLRKMTTFIRNQVVEFRGKEVLYEG